MCKPAFEPVWSDFEGILVFSSEPDRLKHKMKWSIFNVTGSRRRIYTLLI
jgi:hypothetical protein